MKTKTVRQEIEFDASPHEIYELIMDSKKHSGFTQSGCKLSKKVGGKFECYDGYIEGENLELEKDRKIVQKWRDTEFPDGHWSTVTFDLKAKGGKTILKFTHENVPAELAGDIDSGWHEHYWGKMKKYLSKD